MLDLLEARRLLEADAAALAAERSAPEHVAELRTLIDAMPACAGVDEFVENDLAFHRTVALAAGNDVLSKLLESLSGTRRARIWRGITEGGRSTARSPSTGRSATRSSAGAPSSPARG